MHTPEHLKTALAGRYEIIRELGRGGMATVYLARDVRHARQVAIKVLHPELAAVLGAERFLAEITTTANLQHPHILPLFDSGSADGQLFYVMPFVEGETLRARLDRETQLPIGDAVQLAREVADALQYAHDRGVIHRDIKPENILLQGGHALVADFGIALAVQHAGGQRMTQTGLSLGTPQYMAPEQAMGEKAVDARSDVYALGAVSYEMLAGEPPFTGPTPQAIVAKVMTTPPASLRTLRETIPANVDRAVSTALAKLPADRFATAKAFADALRDSQTHSAEAMPSARDAVDAVETNRSARRRAMFAAAMTLVGIAGAAGWAIGRRGAVSTTLGPGSETRFAIESRPGERSPTILGQLHAIAPDGSSIVYVATLAGKTQQLWRRQMQALDATPIEGTTGASDPVFSPDGQSVAFVVGADIMKVPIEGGTPTRIAKVSSGTSRGLTWTSSGDIVFATNGSETLFVVSADGGTPREIFRSAGGHGFRWPVAIRGSDDILFTEFAPRGDTVLLRVGTLKSGAITPLAADMFSAVGVHDGELIYLTRTGELRAIAYDVKARAVHGRSVRIASGVLMSPGTGFGFAAMGAAGDIIFREGRPVSQLVMVSPSGQAKAVVADTLAFENPRISPDGQQIAVSIESDNSKSIWLIDRNTRILSRLSDADIGIIRDRAEWTPDGRSVLYRRNAPSGNTYAIRAADHSGQEALIGLPNIAVNEMVMARDGVTLLGRCSAGQARNQDIMWWTTQDTTLHAYTDGVGLETGARFSPDGKWVAYASETAGRRQVYVSAFPGAGGRVQVSADGAGAPVWGRDGHTVYYPVGRQMMASTLRFTPTVSVVSTRVVLEGDYAFDDPLHATFDIDDTGALVLVQAVRDARTVVIRGVSNTIRSERQRQGAPQ